MKKRSIKVSGHPTSITLEEEFWTELKACANASNLSLNQLVSQIDAGRSKDVNLSSAVRIYLLKYLKSSNSRTDQ
ncbi:MAG: aryl-sulfate sulfotransferase [Micavibrio sp.]|nr:MAG: aryl-sulfate sulfotransferase [Micavibrio sp.]